MHINCHQKKITICFLYQNTSNIWKCCLIRNNSVYAIRNVSVLTLSQFWKWFHNKKINRFSTAKLSWNKKIFFISSNIILKQWSFCYAWKVHSKDSSWSTIEMYLYKIMNIFQMHYSYVLTELSSVRYRFKSRMILTFGDCLSSYPQKQSEFVLNVVCNLYLYYLCLLSP